MSDRRATCSYLQLFSTIADYACTSFLGRTSFVGKDGRMMPSKYDESTSDHLMDVHAHHGIGIDQLLELGEHRMQRDLFALPSPVSGDQQAILQFVVIVWPNEPGRRRRSRPSVTVVTRTEPRRLSAPFRNTGHPPGDSCRTRSSGTRRFRRSQNPHGQRERRHIEVRLSRV